MPKPKKSMSPIFVGEERKELQALRKRDPKQNLRVRWKKVEEAIPEIAERRLGYVPMIIKHGWAVIALPNEGFAYTIGLKYQYNQPELLVVAPDLSMGELQRLLNMIGLYVSIGNRIGPNEPVDLTDFGVSLIFQE